MIDEIRLDKANLKSENIKFRGRVGFKISKHNLGKCKITIRFHDLGDAPLNGHTLTIFEGMIESEMFWGVNDKTFDFVCFEIAEPALCNSDAVFELELLTSGYQLPRSYHFI